MNRSVIWVWGAELAFMERVSHGFCAPWITDRYNLLVFPHRFHRPRSLFEQLNFS